MLSFTFGLFYCSFFTDTGQIFVVLFRFFNGGFRSSILLSWLTSNDRYFFSQVNFSLFSAFPIRASHEKSYEEFCALQQFSHLLEPQRSVPLEVFKNLG